MLERETHFFLTSFHSTDRVFAHNESTDVVYKEIAQPIVQASMNGYDGRLR